MNELLHANIFFFITSAAVILTFIVVLVLLFYILSIIKDVRKISSRTQKEVDAIANDIDAARDGIKNESKKILSLWTVVSNMFSFSKEKAPKTKKTVKKKK